jgi:hypothetical protein
MAARAIVALVPWYIGILATHILGDGVLAKARRQSQPRRWPWQPKTARDYVDAYRAEAAALVTQQGAALLAAVQQQSRRRRWPWQAKTIRDLLDERSADLAEVAAERSAALAEAVAMRADDLRASAERQIRPRRWPWQPKTIRDQLSDQSVALASRAAERSAELALLARQRRDALLREVRRQSRPRRWPWQPKTIRDQIGERGKRVMAEQVSPVTDRLISIPNQTAQTVSQTASAIGERMQQLRSAAPSAIDSATTTAASALKEAAQNLGTTVNATAETAAAAVQRPVSAVNDSVHAGGRRVRRGVRLVRTALWAMLIGIILGLLLATTSGAELRRQLRAIVDQLAGAVRQLIGKSTSG